MAHLYKFHSDVLRGFYQSEVILLAEDRDAAVARAVEAVDAWLDGEEAEYSLIVQDENGMSLDRNEDGYPEARVLFLERLREEAREKIVRVDGDALVMRRV